MKTLLLVAVMAVAVPVAGGFLPSVRADEKEPVETVTEQTQYAVLKEQDEADRRVERLTVIRADTSNGGTVIPIEVGDLIRIPVSTPAGLYGKWQIKVTGWAKTRGVNLSREFKNGKPVLGADNREFDVRAVRKGKVKVEIEVRSGVPGNMPVKVVQEFDVK